MNDPLRILYAGSSSEVRASLIDATARIYAAGLQASGSTIQEHRQKAAADDVDHFLKLLASKMNP